MENFVDDLNSIANVGINKLGSTVSQAFANMITGEEGAGFQQLFKGILSSVGEFITSMGGAIMSYGIAMEAFKKAFSNPVVAIVAGLALMIAGGVVSNLAGSIGTKKFAMGGIVPGSSYSGDQVPVMANSGEMILNSSQQTSLFSMLNSGNNGVNNVGGKEVVFRIQGTELVGVLNNHSRKINSIR
jgi:hypothetical protein